MAIDLNLTDIQSGFLTATAYTANNTLIEQALQDAINRQGGANNEMLADLDMGLNNIINVNNIDVNTVTQNGTDYTAVLSAFADAAEISANNAAASETAAATSATDANQSFLDTKALSDQFRGTYYGAFASDPTQDPLGNPIEEGDIYYNTTDSALKVYDGVATWNNVNEADAVDVVYNNTASGLTATDVQAALDEIDGNVDTNTSNISTNTSNISTNTTAINQRTIYVGSVAELEALSLPVGTNVYLTQEGRAGEFVFRSGDQSANVTNDPEQGVWIAPSSAPTGASGAWMRIYNGITAGGYLDAGWFGAVGDGATDNVTAYGAAIDYAQYKGPATVEFGSGDFLLSSLVSKSLTKNLSLRGAGRGITRFTVPASGGIVFTSSNQSVQCDIQDFDIVASAVTGQAAIDFQWPAQAGLVTTQIKVKSVDVYGANNSSYFDIGLKFLNCSNVTINDCLINGQGGNPATISASSGIFINNGYDYFISDCRFTFWDKAIHLYDYVEGINIDDIKVEYTDYGVFKERVGSIGIPEGLQLNVTDSHLTCRRRGVVVNEHKAYFLSNLHIQCRDDAASPIQPGSVNGLTDFAAIEVQGAQTSPDNEADVAVIENISFRGSTTNNDKSVLYGIVVNDAKDLIIRDCPALSNLAIGINLQSGTTNVNVRNIINRDCTDDIVDDGSGNNVLLREYSRTFTTTLAGGAAQESVDVTVPSGILNDKPEVAILQHGGGTNFLVASYDFDSASSTATNLRFNVQRNDSANIVGAAERFSLYAAETS